jgi:hypothetical protein
VMHDSLDPRDAAREPAPGAKPAARPEPDTGDRELPLAGEQLPSAVHAFLDGDAFSPAELSAVERELEFWKRISSEAGRRRRMVTPAHLPAQILKKLADD